MKIEIYQFLFVNTFVKQKGLYYYVNNLFICYTKREMVLFVLISYKTNILFYSSLIISLWFDHVWIIASGVPIPALLGSPQGPNQWFCGAPVVRAFSPT